MWRKWSCNKRDTFIQHHVSDLCLSSSSSGVWRELKGCSDLPVRQFSLFLFVGTHVIAYGFICIMVASLAITRLLKILLEKDTNVDRKLWLHLSWLSHLKVWYILFTHCFSLLLLKVVLVRGVKGCRKHFYWGFFFHCALMHLCYTLSPFALTAAALSAVMPYSCPQLVSQK